MIEVVSASVPLITCPLFPKQFINEKLVVDALGMNIGAGVELVVMWELKDKFGLLMK